MLTGYALDLFAPCLEARDVLRRRQRRLTLGQEEITPEARAHLHTITDVAEIGDLLQENDFHRGSPSVLIGIWQQRQEARPFDSDRELALVEGFGTGDAARHDLARLGDIPLEDAEILVVDRLDAFGRETAELLAA